MCWPSPDPRPFAVARLDPATYRRHAIHGEDRAWPETNCYTDLIVEMAHALGLDPVAMLPYTLAVDFEGDQWTFFKPCFAELYDLYGFDIQELAISRPLAEHVVEQVEAGRAVLVEVDSWFLPDTAGTAYQLAHAKTTIGVNRIDLGANRMGYFHNAGYFEVEGEDFRRVLRIRNTTNTPGPGTGQVLVPGLGLAQVPVPYLAPVAVEGELPPYVELVKWRRDFVPPRDAALVGRSLEIARRHVERIPASNPFPKFKERFERDMGRLVCKQLCFHDYSFANLRQFGAAYELAATWLRWLAGHGIANVDQPAEALQAIADGAKAFQFQLARAVSRGRALDTAPLDAMATRWDEAMERLRKRLA